MSTNGSEKIPESDVVISSRVRLARNLNDFPFPLMMNREQEKAVMEKVRNAVGCDGTETVKDFLFAEIQSLTPIDRQDMVERHLISPYLANSERNCGALISRDNSISIMINEEDHLRIQCIYPGLQLERAWECCNSIDDMLEAKIEYAFSESYGYLTCCPTNAGTGIRASAMLHIPALAITGYMGKVFDACSKLGIAVRGIYGEHSEALGNMFQLSNQVTLGQTEEEIIRHVNNIKVQIIEQEQTIRTELYSQNPHKFEDRNLLILTIFDF